MLETLPRLDGPRVPAIRCGAAGVDPMKKLRLSFVRRWLALLLYFAFLVGAVVPCPAGANSIWRGQLPAKLSFMPCGLIAFEAIRISGPPIDIKVSPGSDLTFIGSLAPQDRPVSNLRSQRVFRNLVARPLVKGVRDFLGAPLAIGGEFQILSGGNPCIADVETRDIALVTAQLEEHHRAIRAPSSFFGFFERAPLQDSYGNEQKREQCNERGEQCNRLFDFLFPSNWLFLLGLLCGLFGVILIFSNHQLLTFPLLLGGVVLMIASVLFSASFNRRSENVVAKAQTFHVPAKIESMPL
jgi:hypothetical protein